MMERAPSLPRHPAAAGRPTAPGATCRTPAAGSSTSDIGMAFLEQVLAVSEAVPEVPPVVATPQGLRPARLRPARAPRRATSGRRPRRTPACASSSTTRATTPATPRRHVRRRRAGRLDDQHGRRADQEPARERLGRHALHRAGQRRQLAQRLGRARLGLARRHDDPDQAAHLLGKLITYVGPKRVVLGHRQPLVRLAAARDRRACGASSSPRRARSSTACPTAWRATSRTRRSRRRRPTARSATASSAATRREAYNIDPDAQAQRDRLRRRPEALRKNDYVKNIGDEREARRCAPTDPRAAHPARGPQVGDGRRCTVRSAQLVSRAGRRGRPTRAGGAGRAGARPALRADAPGGEWPFYSGTLDGHRDAAGRDDDRTDNVGRSAWRGSARRRTAA